MKINKRSLLWGLASLAVMVVGFIVDSKYSDADFEDHMKEYLEDHGYALTKKED